MSETKEHEFTAADIDAYRDGDWIIVRLGVEIVLRRLTRDRSFDTAWVVFSGNRSPDYPKTRQHFSHVELRGPWRINHNRAHWLRNRLETPIRHEQPQKENP